MPNTKTNIPFGYIAASALDPEIVDELLNGRGSVDMSYLEALDEAHKRADIDAAELGYVHGAPDWDRFVEKHVETQMNYYECDEPDIEGNYEGVTYASSWLGGALNFWIFESPATTFRACRASPYLPGAVILDTLDGSEFGYDVPADWRAEA